MLEFLDSPVELSIWALPESDSFAEKEELDEFQSWVFSETGSTFSKAVEFDELLLVSSVAFSKWVMPKSEFEELASWPNKILVESEPEMASGMEKTHEKKEEEEEDEVRAEGALRLESREKSKREASTPNPKPESTLLLKGREERSKKRNSFLNSIPQQKQQQCGV